MHTQSITIDRECYIIKITQDDFNAFGPREWRLEATQERNNELLVELALDERFANYIKDRLNEQPKDFLFGYAKQEIHKMSEKK